MTSNTSLNMAELLAKVRTAKENEESKESKEKAVPIPTSIPKIGIPIISPTPASKDLSKAPSIEERLANLRNKTFRKAEVTTPTPTPTPELAPATPTSSSTGIHGESITYNSQQQRIIDLGSSGESCVLLGAAGTGKTTCTQGVIRGLLNSPKISIPVLKADGHKYLKEGTPGILIISFTRRAVNNIKKVQSEDMKHNCITAHKLLEYAPVKYEIEDPETGISRNTTRFEPQRNSTNPLPKSIHTIIVEEASMLSTELIAEIMSALTHKVQWIFIGDIQQLPPVFGSAILGFKMLELPVVELTEVYRQALDSPIIKLAHRVLSGKSIPLEEYSSWEYPDKLKIHPWKKRLSTDNACATIDVFLRRAIEANEYDPDEDMILIPFNKAFGTIEINRYIANFLARRRQAITYEIIAGFNRHYFSEGDKIIYDKEDAVIVSIGKNIAYTGKTYQPASANLDYWGHNPKLAEERAAKTSNTHSYEGADIDMLLSEAADIEDRVSKASHEVTVRLLDTGRELTLDTAAAINNILHSYALTVHKAQGSEWQKVFILFHHSHATMIQRELLYTAVTRAREECYIICEPDTFTKGILNQKIKGNTIAEKAEFFKGKYQ